MSSSALSKRPRSPSPPSFPQPPTLKQPSSPEPPTETHRISRRAPVRLAPSSTRIYVTRRASFEGLVNRALTALRKHRFVTVHGLGAAVERTADLALVVGRRAGSPGAVTVHTTTEAVDVVDDWVPTVEGVEAETHVRRQYALHVELTATDEFV